VFSDRDGQDLTLAENDIFFIDIGPVLLGHEADVGASFAVGNDPDMHACAAAARDLWHRVAKSGTRAVRGALYARAAQEARRWAGTSISTCAATAWPTIPSLAPGRQARRS
jgi:methionine aminopeptidase